MADEEELLASATGAGIGTVASVAVFWATKLVLGPTLGELGERLKTGLFTKKQAENLEKTAERARGIAEFHGKDLSATAPHVRVIHKVLNDASLYDDDVQQSYVAGILAGSRNADGSDDRPVFYLSLMDSLTASQLMIFHALYTAAADVLKYRGVEDGAYFTRVRLDVDELNSQLTLIAPDDTREDPAALFALAHAGLIENLEHWETPKKELVFRPTRIGAILYDWAYGFDDEDFRNFTKRDRPDIGLPTLTFPSTALEIVQPQQPSQSAWRGE